MTDAAPAHLPDAIKFLPVRDLEVSKLELQVPVGLGHPFVLLREPLVLVLVALVGLLVFRHHTTEDVFQFVLLSFELLECCTVL